jgi:hypothetical protein
MLIAKLSIRTHFILLSTGKNKTEYRTHWHDLSLVINWSPNSSSQEDDYIFAHLEVRTRDRQPMPISEIEHLGGPVADIKAWLDHQARASEWQTHQVNTNQLSIFRVIA